MLTISETKSLSKGKVAVYARVSTSGQNIETQIQMAKEKLKKNKISDSEVIYYIDNDVSAYKLIVKKRPQFMKLLDDIRFGKISYLIVQARDRLARNFYEHIEIVRCLYKYGVEVEFTDLSQPPFSTDLLTESLHGMLAQNEAMNINSKTKAARDRFPNSKFGFNVFGTKKDKKYEPKTELSKHIQRLYVNVSKLNDAEGLLTLMIENKKQLANPKKFFDCLTNPFYAGQVFLEGTYSPLPHVEPIVGMSTQNSTLFIRGYFSF